MQEEKNCQCSEKQTCFDIILSDLDMPILNGLDFLESQKKKKCKCESVAIMSGNITEDARLRAEKIDIESSIRQMENSATGQRLTAMAGAAAAHDIFEGISEAVAQQYEWTDQQSYGLMCRIS